MAPARKGRIYILELVPPAQGSLLDSPHAAIERALERGKRVERYGRIWIVGPTVHAGPTITGRVGFEGSSQLAELWNEEDQDFHEHVFPQGLTVPFAVNTKVLQIAIQARPPMVKINALIGALRALLNEELSEWKIMGARSGTSLEEWIDSTSRVTSVAYIIRRPNPHYFEATDLEKLMTNFEADTARLEVVSDSPSGVDLGSSFARQTQAHVDRQYGEAVYKGERSGEFGVVETTYSTQWAGEEVFEEIPADPNSGEVPTEELLARLPQEELGSDGQDIGAVE